MKILVAPLEFKSTLTASEAADAISAGLREGLPAAEIVTRPMADGGPGTLDTMLSAIKGDLRAASVRDPLGRTVEARWALLPEGAAIIETAEACGLSLLRPEDYDAVAASSHGAGQLIGAALDGGANRIFIGVGGSASSDGGRGLVEALGAIVSDEPHVAIDAKGLDSRLAEAELIVLSDVRNPLLGPEGATRVFAPQKGARPEQLDALEARMDAFATAAERAFGKHMRGNAGAGAAGGLAFALLLLGARVLSGAEVLARLLGIDEQLKDASALVTGEGRLDSQTGSGKGVSVLLELARRAHVPVHGIFGQISAGEMAFESATSLARQAGSVEEAKTNAGAELQRAALALARRLAPDV